MTTRRLDIRIAVSTSARHPYYKARVLGPRGGSEPGELIIPLQLHIDEALLRRSTAAVRIDIPTPETPTATVLGS
jgi:hypothetical protein